MYMRFAASVKRNEKCIQTLDVACVVVLYSSCMKERQKNINEYSPWTHLFVNMESGIPEGVAKLPYTFHFLLAQFSGSCIAVLYKVMLAMLWCHI